jgi:8-oxo-dGTP diphosphatase
MIDVVCGVIEDGEGRFLACLRPPGKHLGGLWEFPGGKVDPGETPAAALVRELREELGIEVEVAAPLPVVEWNDDDVAIRLLPFRSRVVSGEIHPIEHEAILWCGASDWETLDWAPADVPVIRDLLAMRGISGGPSDF